MKTYRTSIYCIRAGDQPEWLNQSDNKGFVVVTNNPIPAEVTGAGEAWHVIHCAEGTEPPENVASVIVMGHKTPWSADAIAAGWPNGHPYVMEATYLADSPMGQIPRRVKMIDLPEGVTPIETLLVPHEWAGDGEPSI